MTDAALDNGSISEATPPEDMVISYLTMRRILGILGLALPITLAIGGWLTEGSTRLTISLYYHSPSPLLHGLFVGIMVATGVFLICYKGYRRKQLLGDNCLTTIAGYGALGIAFFPTDRCYEIGGCQITRADIVFDHLHNISSLVFFAATAAIAWFLFTKSRPGKSPSSGKTRRNMIYRSCAVIIVVSIVLIVILLKVPEVANSGGNYVVFWLEAIAVWAFGAAWIVKGKTYRLQFWRAKAGKSVTSSPT